MIQAQIAGISYYLPEAVLENDELAELFTGWTAAKIENKLGIRTRHIAADDETATDMAVAAAEKLLDRDLVARDEVDFVLLCTQAPDYFLPSSACVIQDRLGIPTRSGAVDINLGCSGFVYALGMVRGMIETGLARNVLLLTSDTYSKYINRLDRATRPLFGDGAAATLVRGVEVDDGTPPAIGPFVLGTDGSGAKLLMVPAGGHRLPCNERTSVAMDDGLKSIRSQENLYMHGPSIYSFTLNTVPPLIDEMLEKAALTRDEVDLYIFHQANKHMLRALCRHCELPEDRFIIDMNDKGNTVSSTIPMALVDTQANGRLDVGQHVMLVGFGVGLSWAACMVRITGPV